MSCRVETAPEVRAWLHDLRTHDPVAAGLVDDALAALAERGRELGPPVLVPLAPPVDVGRSVADWREQQLERLQEVRLSHAAVAVSHRRGRLDVDANEQRLATLEQQLRDASGPAEVARLTARVSSQRERLAEVREQQVSLDQRLRESEAVNERAHRAFDLVRLRAENLKAESVVWWADAELADVDGPAPAPPSFAELRPARLGEREVRVLLAWSGDVAVLLYGDVTTQPAGGWYRMAVPSALERLRTHLHYRG